MTYALSGTACVGVMGAIMMVSSKKRLLGSGPAKLQRIGLETGVVSKGWSPEPYPDEEIVLQLGLGINNKIPFKEIMKQIGMEDPSFVSIGTTSKADFECEISGEKLKADYERNHS